MGAVKVALEGFLMEPQPTMECPNYDIKTPCPHPISLSCEVCPSGDRPDPYLDATRTGSVLEQLLLVEKRRHTERQLPRTCCTHDLRCICHNLQHTAVSAQQKCTSKVPAVPSAMHVPRCQHPHLEDASAKGTCTLVPNSGGRLLHAHHLKRFHFSSLLLVAHHVFFGVRQCRQQQSPFKSV